jgi:hypothetical protein
MKQAMIDIPPMLRGEIWAVILNIPSEADRHEIYDSVDKVCECVVLCMCLFCLFVFVCLIFFCTITSYKRDPSHPLKAKRLCVCVCVCVCVCMRLFLFFSLLIH